MKKAAFIFLLFLLFTALMMFRKGLLKPEKIGELKKRIFPSLENSSEFSEKKIHLETEEIVQALENLEREKELVEKEKEKLEKWQEHLLLQERELEERANELISLKKKIEDYLKESAAKRESKIKWAAEVYENMRAEEVASIIQKMEDEFALEVLSRMDQRQVAKILATMDPEKVAKLIEKMGRSPIK